MMEIESKELLKLIESCKVLASYPTPVAENHARTRCDDWAKKIRNAGRTNTNIIITPINDRHEANRR